MAEGGFTSEYLKFVQVEPPYFIPCNIHVPSYSSKSSLLKIAFFGGGGGGGGGVTELPAVLD